MNNFVRNTLPALVWLGVIFSLSTGAGGASHTNSFLDKLLARIFPVWNAGLSWAARDAIHFYVRKSAHVTEYAILGALLVRAVRGSGRMTHRSVWGAAWGLATAYAATDEFHQRFVPGRTPKVEDVLIDSVGAAIGVGLMAWVRWRKHYETGN